MRNLMAKIVFEQFFNLTLGRFYTLSEKEELAKLIACANGMGNEENDVLQAVRELEEAEINNFADIQNILLYASISEKCASLTYCAATVLSELYQEKKLPEGYSSKMQWYRASVNRANVLDKAMIAFAGKEYSKSVETLKSASLNSDFPIHEYIAVIAYLNKDYPVLYEYAIRAQQLNEETKVDIPWLLALEKEALDNLSSEEADKIKGIALGKSNKNGSIGFVA